MSTSDRHATRSRLLLVARMLALAVAYVAFARLGLALDAVAGFATLVWPPTGIALAAVVIYGYEMWPGIAVGAVVANLWTGAPLAVAIGIGAGNTLEAILGAYLLRRVPGFRTSLDRIADVFALIGLAALLSTTVSASIGVTSLYLGHIVTAAQISETWRAWWIGDVIGALLVGSTMIVWLTDPRLPRAPARWLEIAALGLSIALVGYVTYFGRTNVAPGAIISVLIWASLRFGPRGATTALLLVATLAIWATARGVGPLVRPHLRDSLYALQTFMGIVAATFLVLSASFAERRRAEKDARLAEERADAANRAKSEFLAVMSHELRTPLNAISGYVDLMAMEVQGPITPAQKESLARVKRSEQHLLGLIDDVLSFAKAERVRLELQPQAVIVRDAIDGTGPFIDTDIQKKELTLVRAIDDSITVNADPDKLRQILLNLLSNAIKYTDRGGQITVGAKRSGANVDLWVADTGIGIPDDQVARVFEPFFQVDRGTTRRYQGIGLGLTIARDLARAMRGDVTLESRVGVGTTVTLSLPADA